VIFILLSFVSYIYYYCSTLEWWVILHHRCKTPESEMKSMISLTRDTHSILDHFNLTHFPFSGSLFGAYRYKNPLPWDTDVDFFIRAEEIEKIDQTDFMAQFKQKGFDIFYSYRSGAYKIARDNADGDLYIFRNYSGTMQRIGLESYYFYFNYKMYHTFPADRIEPPLENVEFCGIQMKAPRGGLEFQKYFFGSDWYLEKKPHGCDNLGT